MRRTIAATFATALALSLVPVSPAGAQEQPRVTVTISSPGEGATFSDRGVVPLVFSAQAADDTQFRIGRIEAVLSGPGVSQQVCAQSFLDESGFVRDQRTANGSLSWSSLQNPAGSAGACDSGAAVPVSAHSLNGTWQLTVTAVPYFLNQPQQPVTRTHAFGLAHPAAQPGGLKLKQTGGGEDITVSWSANTEPDLSAYRVHECIKSSGTCKASDWKQLVDVAKTTTAIAVPIDGPGVYRYRVAALRDGTDQPSAWATDSTPASVEIDDPDDDEQTTTTTAPEEPAGGEEAGEQPAEPEAPRPVVLPRRVQRAAPQVVQRIVEQDRGFDESLPYGEGSDGGEGGGDEEAIGGRPLAGSEDDGDQRALMIPLAGGALFLMIAGHLWYLNRRSTPALATVSPDGDFDELD